MTLTEFYRSLGGNYNDVLSRLPSEKLILKYIFRFPSDKTLTSYLSAVSAENWPEAFRSVHTLKGLYLNLGFESLLENTAVLTEILRGGTAPADRAEFETRTARLQTEYSSLTALIDRLQREASTHGD